MALNPQWGHGMAVTGKEDHKAVRLTKHKKKFEVV
jgi:hypothetical protein